MTDEREDDGLTVRPYRRTDRERVLEIDFETGFFGGSMDSLLDRSELFTRPLAAILDREPDLCFVAERENEVEGYVAGSEAGLLRGCLARIGGTFGDLTRLPLLSARDREFILSRLRFALRAPLGEERRFRTPQGPRLHVNVRAALRGTGTGTRLLECLFEELRRRGASRVLANSYQTARNVTSGFWLRNGFREFSRVRTTVWGDVFEDPVDLVCFVRDLS